MLTPRGKAPGGFESWTFLLGGDILTPRDKTTENEGETHPPGEKTFTHNSVFDHVTGTQ